MRLTWLAAELRAAGLTVIEVGGWQTRGSDTFNPRGVTWHATAGSRKATAQGEVNVILFGSSSAPPPIAQLMIWRDGTIYVCAAGRCHHNKVGWAGPNKGLGNTDLLGIEMANDNAGEPWPAVQLDAARRATAAIMRRLGVDPMRRLAAHYEHQPYAGRPVGETSTKSDPFGVNMAAERPRVAALMEGDDMSWQEPIPMGEGPNGRKWPAGEVVGDIRHLSEASLHAGNQARDEGVRNGLKLDAVLKAIQGVNEEAVLAAVHARADQLAAGQAALTANLTALPGAVAAELENEGGVDAAVVQAAVERALARLRLTVGDA